MIQLGDIIAIEGSTWRSADVIRTTRRAGDEQASHVGLITSLDPFYQVTEALWHVTSRPLAVSLGDAKRAWVLSLNGLTSEERQGIAWTTLQYEGRPYGFIDILWQFLDAIFHTRWWTDHLGLRTWPICSMLDDLAYESVGVHITRVSDASITPNDVLETALKDPKHWTVTKIK